MSCWPELSQMDIISSKGSKENLSFTLGRKGLSWKSDLRRKEKMDFCIGNDKLHSLESRREAPQLSVRVSERGQAARKLRLGPKEC